MNIFNGQKPQDKKGHKTTYENKFYAMMEWMFCKDGWEVKVKLDDWKMK